MNRIKELRELHKESAEELGAAIGKSQPTISKWENMPNLKYEFAAAVAKHYNTTPEVVLGREKFNKELMAQIDIIDAKACCGNGLENYCENVIGKHLIPQSELSLLTSTTPKKIKMIKVEGDSMTPTLYSGDMVLVDISENYPSGDGLYVLRIGDMLMVKRIQINPFDNSIEVKSDNPVYQTSKSLHYKDATTIGKVIYIYSVRKVG
jgi:transcriptional regulator with XRE-family HTH domain